MMDYILTGDPKYVEAVLKITSYMVQRGDIKFIPVNQANVGVLIADDKYVASERVEDGKEPQFVDHKKPVKRRK